MKARLAFAVSVNIDPDILIIDEVLAVGDELFRRKSFAKIEEFFRAGKTILFVSHVVQNVNQLCSRAIMLHNGQIVLDGPTKFVTMNYQKFIFSKPAEQISLIQEFEQLTPSGTFLPSDSALEHPENVHNRSVLGRESNNCDFTEYYVENYLPKSTVITKNADIDIQNIRIVTDEGKKVNHLVPGRKYTILYDVHFNEEVAPVNFGIGIHTEQGVPVTWKIFPGSKLFMPIDRLVSDWRTVKWTFCCTLIPDVYFLGMALRIQGHEGPSVIFKGSDIFAFKVQGYKDVDIGGYFDAAFQVEVF
jgi:lipopolysaccharide transport system ATP-binding protein